MPKKLVIFFTLLVLITCSPLQSYAAPLPANEKGFPVPNNMYCSNTDKLDLSFNLTNMSDTSATLTVHFYKKDGTSLTVAGTTYNGIESTIVPGTAFELKAYQTTTYHTSFGGDSNNCSDRVYAGKIVNHSKNAAIVATGWVGNGIYASPIVVNGGDCWSNSCEYTPNIVPLMTSNTAPSGIADSSSYNIRDSGYYAYLAFDHNTTTDTKSWQSLEGTPTGWLSYEFTTPKVIRNYTLYSQVGGNNKARAPKNWTFEAWDETTSKWVTLDTQNNVTDWADYVAKEFPLNNNYKAYKKYRINITANNGATNFLTIGELELKEMVCQ